MYYRPQGLLQFTCLIKKSAFKMSFLKEHCQAGPRDGFKKRGGTEREKNYVFFLKKACLQKPYWPIGMVQLICFKIENCSLKEVFHIFVIKL